MEKLKSKKIKLFLIFVILISTVAVMESGAIEKVTTNELEHIGPDDVNRDINKISQTTDTPFPHFKPKSTSVGLGDVINDKSLAIGLDTGSGAIVLDYNNDGYEDIILYSHSIPKLYENVNGTYRLKQRITGKNYTYLPASVGHAFDADNDGSQELLFSKPSGNIGYFDEQNNKYQQENVITSKMNRPVSIASGDITNNGCLDFVVAQNNPWGENRPAPLNHKEKVINNYPDISKINTDKGGKTRLFKGNCQGEFTEITDKALPDTDEKFSYATSVVDLNDDDKPEIHISNDFDEDFIYINTGNKFERKSLGLSSARNGMGSHIYDINSDAKPDIFVPNIYLPEKTKYPEKEESIGIILLGNNMFTNTGNNSFKDIAPKHGLQKGGFGWGGSITDYSNNGRPDVMHGVTCCNDYEKGTYNDIYRTVQIWNGEKNTWEKISGPKHGFDTPMNNRDITHIDYNTDGRLDVLTPPGSFQKNLENELAGKPFQIYENTGPVNGDAMQLLLRNYDGLSIGAEIQIHTTKRIIHRTYNSNGGVYTQESRMIHTGTNKNETIKSVEVEWPSGKTVNYNVTTNKRYVLTPNGTSKSIKL